jgi:hypothetical protein
VDRAGKRGRDVLGPRRLEAPLDERVDNPSRVAVGEVRLHGDLGADLLASRHQQRRVVRLRVEDRPHAVAHPRRGVQVDVRRTARGLCVAVRHPHGDGLLQPE